jgi:predicted RNA-binding Zn-ribbon protein involved in translation (DUF1610 family)
MQSKMIRQFTYSAGALLLAAAMGMFISTWAGTGLIHPHDPIFKIPIPRLFWIVGGLELLIALICLFGKRVSLQVTLVLWLAMNFTVYQIGLWGMGVSGGFKGYLGDVSAAFGISFSTADLMMKTLVLYLLSGSILSLLWLWIKTKSGESQSNKNGYLKTPCPACGGHIRFAAQNLGQTILCPHCREAVTLQAPGNLKMICVLCGGHVEFPAHALGQKIPCPHCAKTITLLNPLELKVNGSTLNPQPSTRLL